MPINIYGQASEEEHIAWLCDGIWELPDQLDVLEKWVTKNKARFTKGSYVADIGFSPRSDAKGGGGILTVSAMQTMAEIGMTVFFSEYSECEK